MSAFDSFKFRFWDPAGTVRQLINTWNPSDCNTEKDYEKSLYSYLRSHLQDIVITPQYAYGRAKADLVVGGKVAIEIKKDLKGTSEFQRLLGQITQFKQWKGSFIVLLVGSTDLNLLDELRNQSAEVRPFGLEPKVSIIEKIE